MARESREVRIRPLNTWDHKAVVRLLAACQMSPHTRGRDSATAFRRQLAAHPTTYLGAFVGERLVGCVFGTHDSRKGWINRLAVDPGFRREGIATRLVTDCERRLRRQGMRMFAALIEKENRASVLFFRSLGYEVGLLHYARKKRNPDV